jgi:tetrahydromethanopterin S-methyltransferase subunit E
VGYTWIKQNTGLGQVNHSLIIFIMNVIIIYILCICKWEIHRYANEKYIDMQNCGTPKIAQTCEHVGLGN